MNILVTGGAGYIGSHTAVELLNNGHTVIIIDNLANSSAKSIDRIQEITKKSITFYQADLQDRSSLDQIFSTHSIDAVIHFAGLKAVGESSRLPLLYYRINIDSTLTLLETMQAYNVNKLVFSSSATVYGSSPIPYVETQSTGVGITNPYGRTKYMIEEILRDATSANPELEVSSLRYFNPIGAHPSGLIGEDPQGIPNNLMPFLAQVATGKRELLNIFGNDYGTPDGTCIRDYIHVVDLARGHVAAITHFKQGFTAINLGSGQGTSVLELHRAFEKATGVPVPYAFAPRREGDLPAFYADPSKAAEELDWRTELTIEDACRDTWNWQSNNPNGYSN